MTSGRRPRIEVPDELVAWHRTFFGDRAVPWLAALPDLAETRMDRWRLEPDGPARCGAVALVVPVLRTDGTPAALKLQPVDDETCGEPFALRTWDGNGAVRLLEHDPPSGSMLLERLDATRSLATVQDDMVALQILSALLARLCVVAAPPGLGRLADVAQALVDRAPPALTRCADRDRRLVLDCAAAVRDLLPEPADRLLHLDLHFGNILATHPERAREPWLAIDPKPLAGDPGFELLPALHNRWDDVIATGAVPRAVRRRFDLMTDVVGLDRPRAVGWTLGRILQNVLWDVEHDSTSIHAEQDRAIGQILLGRS